MGHAVEGDADLAIVDPSNHLAGLDHLVALGLEDQELADRSSRGSGDCIRQEVLGLEVDLDAAGLVEGDHCSHLCAEMEVGRESHLCHLDCYFDLHHEAGLHRVADPDVEEVVGIRIVAVAEGSSMAEGQEAVVEVEESCK